MKFYKKLYIPFALLLCAAAIVAANPVFAKSSKIKKHGKTEERLLASDDVSLLEVDGSGDVKVDGESIKIHTGKEPMRMMSAKIVGYIPVDISFVPAFKLQPLELMSKDGPDGKTTFTKLKGGEQTLLADSDWRFYQDEQHIDAQHELKLSFPMDKEQLDAMNGRVALFVVPEETTPEKLSVSWNECSGAGAVTGNYAARRDFPCVRKRFLADEYAAYIRDHMLTCVNAGMKNAGLGTATKVHIAHDGTEGDPAHKRTPSLHNAGRAIDVQRMLVTTAGGSTVFDFRKTNTDRRLSAKCAPASSANCKYFEGFRECWSGLMKARACPRNRNPRRRWIGTLGWEDRKHIAHHLHTSMPFCPRSAGYWTTAFDDEVDADDGDTLDPVDNNNSDGIEI